MEEVNDQAEAIAAERAMRELAEMIASIEIPEPTFVAVYDPHTGEVISIGPTAAFEHEHYKVDVDKEIALDVIEGRVRIGSCYVDVDSETMEIVEVKNVFKIDDILHRIPLKEYADFDKPDLFVTYLQKTKKLKIELSEEQFGTRKLPKKFQPVKQKKTRWAGDTTLRFLITEYNDPHAIIEVVELTIDDLIGNKKIITDIEVPKKFSIFTRRIFKNYVMEVK